jgi:CRP/FNR family cyclic AMP-dependent transcriptional regulator
LLTASQFDRALAAAIRKSHLARLSEAVQQTMLSRSTRIDVPARSNFFRPGDPARTALVVSGLGRLGVVSAAGNDLTVMWVHAGEWIGIATIFEAANFRSAGIFAQAVTDLSYLDIPADLVRELARTDPAVAWVAAEFLADRLAQTMLELLGYAQGDLRSRVVRRLLELAVHQPEGSPLIASITQEELAKAVGAARPSVARILAELKREGLVRTVRGGLLITRPDELTLGGRIGAA